MGKVDGGAHGVYVAGSANFLENINIKLVIKQIISVSF
jgi:hypothetical protein